MYKEYQDIRNITYNKFQMKWLTVKDATVSRELLTIQRITFFLFQDIHQRKSTLLSSYE